ncbi:Endonuclease/exonuclease/phosphatase [Infundibulicybe gibba]|nr:Endonuclease/exonuclease/phosphatase [Infundibulicybe gibba]
MIWLYSLVVATTYITAAASTTIADIQGSAFLSPLVGQTVQNVIGVVTAKASNGFYISGDRVKDPRVSNGLFVFSTPSLSLVSVGDKISLGGKVAEFRSATSPDNLFTTELDSPTNITIISSNNTLTPLVLGKDRSPPTEQLSALDTGHDGFLSVPNNRSRVSIVNATLQPNKFGMDFWESLEGQLVTIPKPIATDFQNSFGEFWVYGDWKITGKNSRGGISITFGPGGVPDGNPETVIIGSPLDKTKNPKVAVGVGLSDITGVVAYHSDHNHHPDRNIPPTKIQPKAKDACSLTFGDYNVENMTPKSTHIPTVASQISTSLLAPDLMFIQEIQDNSGATDDGTVIANLTLSTLVAAIAKVNNVTYDFIDIAPVDGQDGGEPGGNIRQAYLYRPEKLSLVPGSPAGGSLDSVEVVPAAKKGKPTLNFNPGRIDPTNAAWNASRKPLVAAWRTAKGDELFTINLHLTSKGGSSTTQGDARPPVNLPVAQRTSQVEAVSTFVKSILAQDSKANIIVAGDFNEFVQTRSVAASLEAILTDIDEAANIRDVERYTYVFDQSSQQLDHVFISNAIKHRKLEFEHIHVNNWSPTLAARVSDHDPSVGQIHVC